MKKLLIAATLATTALAATALMADPGHGRGQRQAGASEGCPTAGAQQGNREARHAEMQARRAAMQAQMGGGHGRGAHQGRGEGCPAQQTPAS